VTNADVDVVPHPHPRLLLDPANVRGAATLRQPGRDLLRRHLMRGRVPNVEPLALRRELGVPRRCTLRVSSLQGLHQRFPLLACPQVCNCLDDKRRLEWLEERRELQGVLQDGIKDVPRRLDAEFPGELQEVSLPGNHAVQTRKTHAVQTRKKHSVQTRTRSVQTRTYRPLPDVNGA